MNYVDIFIVLVLLYHIVRGYYIGFFALFARLISFFIAISGAFWVYSFVGDFIASKFNTLPVFSYGLGYIISFFVIQIVASYFINKFFTLIPERVRTHKASMIAGIAPGALDGLIFISLILLVLLISPTPESIRNDIRVSTIGGVLANNFTNIEQSVNKFFGGAIERSLSLLTTESESEGIISIPYKPTKLVIDEQAEIKMLEFVNQERALVGAPALVMEQTLVQVARAHSKDMWERGYFSHVSPEGEDPFARMRAGGANFLRAGENIALAPNVEVAHRGLMNSPGHKRNILDPNFRRVGIGIINGGIYGEMYTQDFSD